MTSPRLLPAFGRLLLALMFILSAVGKLAAPEATQASIAAVGLPLPLLSYFASILVELIGGVLLVIGYQTRLTAVGIAVFSIITAIIFHHNFADQNQMIHFLKNIAIAGGLLQVAAFGAGAFSIDARRSSAA